MIVVQIKMMEVIEVKIEHSLYRSMAKILLAISILKDLQDYLVVIRRKKRRMKRNGMIHVLGVKKRRRNLKKRMILQTY